MAAGTHRESHDIQLRKETVPLKTCEASFDKHVGELVFGVDIFDLDLGVQIDLVKQI